MYGKVTILLLCLSVCYGHLIDPDADAVVDHINKVIKPSWVAEKPINFEAIKEKYGQMIWRNKTKKAIRILESYDANDDDYLPREFDARVRWPHCPSIEEVKDESNCDSSWAIVAASVLSDRVCIHSNGRLTPTLSARNIISCAKEIMDGCEGGEKESAWTFMKDQGVVTGGDYGEKNACQPYPMPPCSHHEKGPLPLCKGSVKAPTCSNKCQPGYSKQYSDDKIYSKKAYYVRKDHIRREIFNNGPVQATLNMYYDFYFYKSGVYDPTSIVETAPQDVRIIGWGIENGVPYWLCVNSWNKYWGDNGYFKIRRGDDVAYIESDVMAGLPNI